MRSKHPTERAREYVKSVWPPEKSRYIDEMLCEAWLAGYEAKREDGILKRETIDESRDDTAG